MFGRLRTWFDFRRRLRLCDSRLVVCSLTILVLLCLVGNVLIALLAMPPLYLHETKGVHKPTCRPQGCLEESPEASHQQLTANGRTTLLNRVQETDGFVQASQTDTSLQRDTEETQIPNMVTADLASYNIAGFVNKQCSQLDHQTHLPYHKQYTLLSHLLYDDTHRLIYCSIPKAGSSNWKRLFLALQYNISEVPRTFQKYDNRVRGGPLKFLHRLPPNKIAYRLKHYFRFMITRNPAERLASVYFHKLTNFTESVPFKKKYAAVIHQASQANTSQQLVTADTAGQEVTFEQFVRYLVSLRVRDMNEHWMPAVELCQPCIINYEFIGRFEQLPLSAQAVLRVAKLDSRIHYPKQPMFYRGPPVKLDEVEIFDKLSPELRMHFWKLYRSDFELFDYSFAS